MFYIPVHSTNYLKKTHLFLGQWLYTINSMRVDFFLLITKGSIKFTHEQLLYVMLGLSINFNTMF